MYTTTDAYNEAVKSLSSEISIYISVGTSIDTTAADDLSSVTADALEMSNTAQICDAVYSLTPGLATFEGDGIPTALDEGMVAPPLEAHLYPPETGLWSKGISDATGAIEWSLTLSLSAEHTSALTLYTDGPDITGGSVAFTASDGSVATSELVCSSGRAQVADAHPYMSIKVTITGISEAYHHVRIAEIEFGASRALSKSDLSGSVVCIEEQDPLETSSPMYELDFSILNVDGSFDRDNPDTRLGEYAVGLPVLLSYTVTRGSDRWTVPCGRYWIGERSSTDTTVEVSAFDARWFLSKSFAVWSLSTGTSIGATLEALLQDLGVPHLVDDALLSVYPDADHTFTDDSSVLEDCLRLQQAYGVYLVPGRDGVLTATTEWPSGSHPDVAVDTVLSWPSPKQRTGYNYVSVGYKSGFASLTVDKDLRDGSGESKSVLSITNNPLITTESRAKAVLERVAARIPSEEVESREIGDPAMDLGDVVAIPGRWTQSEPVSYTVVRIERTWSGMYSEIARAVKLRLRFKELRRVIDYGDHILPLPDMRDAPR